jgi:type IV pilus assembly protein PilE
MSSPRIAGFTLIELMITVVVIAILAAIGYPSYTRWVAETRRTDATMALQQIAAMQERFMTQCSRYADDFGGNISHINAALACTGLGMNGGGNTFTTTDGHYDIVLVTSPVDGENDMAYLLTASPNGPQATADGAKCATFTLNHVGVKGATGAQSTKCWKK